MPAVAAAAVAAAVGSSAAAAAAAADDSMLGTVVVATMRTTAAAGAAATESLSGHSFLGAPVHWRLGMSPPLLSAQLHVLVVRSSSSSISFLGSFTLSVYELLLRITQWHQCDGSSSSSSSSSSS
jgi:hypothetical protein